MQSTSWEERNRAAEDSVERMIAEDRNEIKGMKDRLLKLAGRYTLRGTIDIFVSMLQNEYGEADPETVSRAMYGLVKDGRAKRAGKTELEKTPYVRGWQAVYEIG